ncbi:Putative transcriptional regulator [plant metagenome]|uniref:Transcriptional regulator n=1 Tax=plant metagenome TaxID=1297885 RepID=A0A484RE59_9ZZZZ
MRQVIDCAVLWAPGQEGWVKDWMARREHALPRARLLSLPLAAQAPDGPAPDALWRLQQVLRRYDLAILPVAPEQLAWSRMALSAADGMLPVPLLGLAHGLRAAAIQDLLGLGLSDFVRVELEGDDLGLRLACVARRKDALAAGALAGCGGAVRPATARSSLGNDAAGTSSPGGAPGLAEPDMPYALASRASLPSTEETLSFRAAKSRVVAAFEHDYLSRALRRSGGNIAMAARQASKHRRAFWGLMRKHRIDAEQFRQGAEDDRNEPKEG